MSECPWFVKTNLDQRIRCNETGEHTTHTYPNVFQVDRSEYVVTLEEDQ